MTIQNELNKIKSAVLGKDVRDAIHDSIQKTYNDATESGNANMEVEMARGIHPNLNKRLEVGEKEIEVEKKRIDNLAKLSEGSTTGDAELIDARVGADGITYSNTGGAIRNQFDKINNDFVSHKEDYAKAVTYEKIDFADEISIRAKNILLNGNFSIESETDISEGWDLDPVNTPLIENNTLYWHPVSTLNSAALAARSWAWVTTAIAGHMYCIICDQTNIRGITFVGAPSVTKAINSDGKHALIFTANTSERIDPRFLVRTANVETSIKNIIVVDLTETFGAGNEPEAEYFAYLLQVLKINEWFGGTINLTNATKNGIITARDLKLYDPEGLLASSNVNDALIELKKKLDSSSGFDPESLHQLALNNLKTDNLREENRFLKINGEYSLRNIEDKESDIVEFNLKNTNKQKLILHLHKRANDGFDTVNDAYLPNAEDDFSDVQIKSESGKALPYRVVYYSDALDIIADSRLGINHNTSEIYKNSLGEWFTKHTRYLRKSTDEGVTWTLMSAFSGMSDPRIVLMTHDDAMFVNHGGYIYRSDYPYDSYETVFDLTTQYAGTLVQTTGMQQHPDGEIFFGSYQEEFHILVYKSTDNGFTWDNVLDDTTYQHVHGMYIDEYQTPPAIYVGVDGYGGVYKSTDKGNSWVELRGEYPGMPNSTDFGVTYADPSGYRLLGGETSVAGGYSIIKTTDDKNFRSALGIGTGVLRVIKKDGRLFAGGAGKLSHKYGTILVSTDEGETWEQAYTTSPMTDSNGANDGFRYMSDLDNQIVGGMQSPSRAPVRIFTEGKYAEIVVDVPADTISVTVESGQVYPNIQPIYNDTDNDGEYLVNVDLNEGGQIIKESVSGRYFQDDFEWADKGKHLSYFYPHIHLPGDSKSVFIKSLNGYKVDSSNFDVSGGVVISFWGNLSNKDTDIDLFRTDLGDVFKLDASNAGIKTSLNGAYRAQLIARFLPESFIKFDMVINPNGDVEVYNNGLLIDARKYNSIDVLNSINNSSEMTILNTINKNVNHSIQHFSIRKGVISEKQLNEEFNSSVTDNMI